MRYGITGPHKGLTESQERYVADTVLFVLMDSEPPATEFWSGCAYGVDTIGVSAAERIHGLKIGLTVPRIHENGVTRQLLSNYKGIIESNLVHPIDVAMRWVTEYGPPGRTASDGYLKRDELTVSKIDCLLAFPKTPKSELRSGTWATIRMAREAGVEIWFYPLDGSNPWIEIPDEVERMQL